MSSGTAATGVRTPEVVAALTTPLTADGQVDLDAFQANVARVGSRLDGVFIAGTTGEFPALSPAEHGQLSRCALDVLAPHQVVVHIGAASVDQALQLADRALALGARRFAAITPYYLASSPAETARHFARLRSGLDGVALYAYIYPDTAGTDVPPQEIAALAATGIDGVKLSGLASTRVGAYRAALGSELPIWSGNDRDVAGVLEAGGCGVISGVAGVVPQPWADLKLGYERGDQGSIDLAQQRIDQLVPLLGPSISRLKYGMQVLGLAGSSCRMSIEEPDDQLRREIAERIKEDR